MSSKMLTDMPLAFTMAPPTPECNVEVRPSPIAGNGLFATKDIPTGSTILLTARPLVGELDLARLQDTCHNCFSWTYKTARSCAVHNSTPNIEPGCPGCETSGQHANVKACSGCKKVKYCSKTCQKQAWNRYHKKECRLLRDPALPPLPNSVRAALQLAIFMNDSATSEQGKASVRRLQAHEYSTIEQLNEVEQYEASIAAARDLFGRLSPNDPEGSEIREYMGKILRNSLTLTTPTLDPLGIAFDPIACTANHSCKPNASVLFDVPRLMMRSLAPIAKDEEVFISYIDNTNPFAHRQAELQLRYCFHCECPRCQIGPSQSTEDQWLRPAKKLERKWVEVCGPMDEMENFSDDPANHVGTSAAEKNLAILQGKAFQSLEEARSRNSSPAAIESLEGLMRLCKQTNMWPITRQPYAAARVDIFAHMVNEGRIALAICQAAKTYFLIDPILYPQEFHPVRVVHTWGLVKALVEAYSSPNDPEVTVDPGVQELFDRGFDFVVPIWKILSKLSQDVLKSHGSGSNLTFMIHSVTQQVRTGVGMDNLREIERDPLRMWKEFEKFANYIEY